MQRTFTLDYWKDDDWYVGKLREVPGVFSQGETVEELIENIVEAYRLILEEARETILASSFKTTEVAISL